MTIISNLIEKLDNILIKYIIKSEQKFSKDNSRIVKSRDRFQKTRQYMIYKKLKVLGLIRKYKKGDLLKRTY